MGASPTGVCAHLPTKPNTRYNRVSRERYNFVEDRCETNDLITTYPERGRELEKEWMQW